MPYIVVELLSPSTEKEDLGQTLRDVDQPPTKWQVYEQILRIPYYVIYDRYQETLKAYALSGSHYRELELAHGRLWLAELQLGIGLWSGEYRGVSHTWLRCFDADEQWISCSEERATQQSLRAEREAARARHEATRAEKEKQRADKLAEKLRSLGVDPDEL